MRKALNSYELTRQEKQIEITKGEKHKALERSTLWSIEHKLHRMAYGKANRADRLTALGNGRVPAVMRRASEELGGR